MNKNDIYGRCVTRRNEILEKYFGKVQEENATSRAQTLEEKYNRETPFDAEDEFFDFLEELHKEVNPDDTRKVSEMIDRPLKRDLLNDEYQPAIENAYRNAQEISFKEKILKSNHKDVAFFKGLLKQYTEELLDALIEDYMGDVEE